ncbi:MAG: class I SAM-dependent methyltransferase [Gammaproteobacteria bacterium]|nr:MAG: class I SAM-dependent methyltransferase [Gammaproteobacteria bacterium]
MEQITACRVCRSPDIVSFFDLGRQPLANSLLPRPDEPEVFYPLSLRWCSSCRLVQLDHTADPKELFSSYVWVTGTSNTAQEYARRFQAELARRCPERDGYVLEIASNDGTFLAPFRDAGYRVLGVDPAQNIVRMAVSNGIPSVCAFWGNETAESIRKDHGPAHIIFARNVLPHVANTHEFVNGLKTCLRDDGILAIEVHYSKIILEELHYDSIYHEHLCYFTLRSLERLLNGYGFLVFDITTSPISGGSIVVYASKGERSEEPVVQEYRDRENRSGTNERKSWETFAEQSFRHREELLEMLRDCRQHGTVIGYGASARSSTLLNFCGIDHTMLPMIADRNPLKYKKYTAGTHILIENPDVAMKLNPHYVLILAWNFASEIMDFLEKQYGYNGHYIIPFPNQPLLRNSGQPFLSLRA